MNEQPGRIEGGSLCSRHSWMHSDVNGCDLHARHINTEHSDHADIQIVVQIVVQIMRRWHAHEQRSEIAERLICIGVCKWAPQTTPKP